MIKTAFWNALSILVLMAIIGVVAVFGFLFVNPYSGLNPFPPPTVPVALNLPTFTPTYPQLPPTWTPAVQNQQAAGPTLRPSSTLLLKTDTFVILNSKTPIPTRTSTATPTPTSTQTDAKTRTLTQTPNLTNTALAQVVTDAVRTAQAKTLTSVAKTSTSQARTATAQAAGPGGTQTVEAMPPNPASATETNGALNDVWQSLISDPAFTWQPVSGASGYYVYWGNNAAGTGTSQVTAASYNPQAVAVGTYFLRLRTIFPWGERSNWTTVFTFRFDNTQPAAPVSAVETHGATSDVWQSGVSDPAFTWTGASDTGSGVARYDVYFGSNPNGVLIVASPGSAAYDPAALVSGAYYLRVRSVDGAGQVSGWVTLFIFRYDGTAPGVPGSLQTSDPSTDPSPAYTWSASSDSHSGLAAYEIFWGPGTSCDTKNQPDQTETSFTPPEVTEAGDYTICVRARDNSGNTSNWAQNTFTYTP